MFTELLSHAAQKKLDQIKKDPVKYKELVSVIVGFTEFAAELVKDSTEFREAFAQIHSQFLQYPECKAVIRDALAAYGTYFEDERFTSIIDRIPPP